MYNIISGSKLYNNGYFVMRTWYIWFIELLLLIVCVYIEIYRIVIIGERRFIGLL